jgi:CheY-like chemotaxis protein
MKLLFVDDSPDICEVVEISLEPTGWDVRTAASGADALERVREDRPDVVLLDVRMPGMDGPETLRRLRALPNGKDIPVIFMTALSRKDIHAEIEELKPAGVLTKPFWPSRLQGLIEACLAVWRLGELALPVDDPATMEAQSVSCSDDPLT